MGEIRKPFLVIAVILLVIVVLIELGSHLYIGNHPSAGAAPPPLPTPGFGITYLAFVDGIVLFVIGMFGLSVFVPARVLGAIQGIVSFVFTLLMLIGSVIAIFAAITLLMLMISLLLAVPFGTIAYMIGFGHFEVGRAEVTLGVLMFLKLAVVVMLFLAQEKFVTIKGLVLLMLTSLLANIVVSFLHGLMPMFLVSILDMVAAIVVGVLGAVWALVKLFGSIPGVLKGIRLDRQVA